MLQVIRILVCYQRHKVGQRQVKIIEDIIKNSQSSKQLEIHAVEYKINPSVGPWKSHDLNFNEQIYAEVTECERHE